MGTTASIDVRGARAWGDPGRRLRLRLGALLVVGVALVLAAGGGAVLWSVRGELLRAAATGVETMVGMQLEPAAGGRPQAPPLSDATGWNDLLNRFRSSGAFYDVRVWDASGTLDWAMRGVDSGASLKATALQRALDGQRTVSLGTLSDAAGAKALGSAALDVVLPVAYGAAGGTASQRGALEIVTDGSAQRASLRRVWLELGLVSLLLLLVLIGVVVYLANVLAARSLRDRLTGAANLRRFEMAAATMLPRLKRHARPAAVVVIDLKRLSNVNDALGHRAGDTLLRFAANVLRSETRPGDVVARVGGQFLALLDEADRLGAEAFAKRILAALERTVDVGTVPVRLRATAGIAAFPDDGTSLDELRAHAHTALREAKAAELPYFAYREGLAHGSAEALALESDLASAIANGEMVLYGQSVVDMASGAVAGLEALARWQHPKRGLLTPGSFVPQAEATNLIRDLDRWAFDTAAAVASRWAQTTFEGFISVNFSAQSLDDRALPDAARLSLERHGAPAEKLVVEVTETAAIRDLEGSRNVLEALRALGLRVALDDFGTGYSSLAYLRKLPVDLIKIDRQFIEHVADQRSDQVLVRALVTYAQGLGLGVVAEGIETERQHDWLARAGVVLAQGFLYGVPEPLDRPPSAASVPAPKRPAS